MDIAITWLLVIGPLVVSVAAAIWWGNGDKILAIWVAVGGFIIFIVAAALQVQAVVLRSAALSDVAKLPAVAETRTHALNQTIRFECRRSPFPDTAPPSGMLHLVRISFPTVQEIGPYETPLAAGTKIDWPNVIGLPNASLSPPQLCRITNYGEKQIFNLQLDFPASYRKAIPEGNTSKSGEVVAQTVHPIIISKLDPGDANAFEFFIYNAKEYWVILTLPTSASISHVGSGGWEPVPLIPYHPGSTPWIALPPAPEAAP